MESLESRCFLSAAPVHAAAIHAKALTAHRAARNSSVPSSINGVSTAAPSSTAVTSQDQSWIAQTVSDDLLEIDLNSVVQAKASSPDVKAMAQRFYTDHSANLTEFQQILTSLGISSSTTLDAKNQATLTKLSKLSGAKFDKAYTAYEMSDHSSDIKDFSEEIQNTRNTQLESFAASTLPVLETHLNISVTTNATVKSEK
jgi:putative membrane protein